MQINHKLKIIILGATLFLYKTINYYNSDDAIHVNHTLSEEIEELNFNNKIYSNKNIIIIFLSKILYILFL
jgi:hypothetical protein